MKKSLAAAFSLVTFIALSTALKTSFAGSGAPDNPRPAPAARNDAKAKASPAAAKGGAAEPITGANLKLATDLDWTFGGKQQRGWRLYTPLISELIGLDDRVEGGDFASALTRWQEERGLAPNGILDQGTWSRMVATWQSRRIKDRAYPTAEQLVTAPASDFYDPTRPEDLRRVERRAYAAYKRMIAAAAADPSLGLAITPDGDLAASERYLKIVSSFRSREYQDHLRRQSPGSGRAGLAVNSPHFTGRALDLYVGGEPVSTRDDNRAAQVRTRAYQWLVKHAGEFGFRPYFYEPWHGEYCGDCSAPPPAP